MHAHTTTHTLILGGVKSRDHRISDLLLEAAYQMETLSLFADQVAWDNIIARLRTAAAK